MCVYVYTYIHTHTRTYVYVYIHIHVYAYKNQSWGDVTRPQQPHQLTSKQHVLEHVDALLPCNRTIFFGTFTFIHEVTPEQTRPQQPLPKQHFLRYLRVHNISVACWLLQQMCPLQT